MPPPPELPEELVGEILLHLPPEEPANLLRASLVCKSWCGLLSDPVFRRRYCRYHRTPPLLGFVHDEVDEPRFVSTVASPCSPPALDCDSWWALDCRHGRVLIHSFKPSELVVWDPLTREQQHLPLPPYPHIDFTGAVLCAVADCDHLDCHGSPFLVVFVGMEGVGPTWASIYSSETGAWSATTSSIELDMGLDAWPSLRIGDSLYFMVDQGMSILRYDLAGGAFSTIDVPAEYEESMGTFVMVEDGRLGFVGVEDRSLHLWSWQEAGVDGSAGWKQRRVIELTTTTLPISDKPDSIGVVGFVEGADVVFLSIDVVIFALKINSGRVVKVGDKGKYFSIIPYSSFWLPGV
ncbi:hypothetical protein EJB05_15363, partial [Eragrostis curvula]